MGFDGGFCGLSAADSSLTETFPGDTALESASAAQGGSRAADRFYSLDGTATRRVRRDPVARAVFACQAELLGLLAVRAPAILK